MAVFVLAPLMFAVGALLTEAHALLLQSRPRTRRASQFRSGCSTCRWPGSGWHLWENKLAHPGALRCGLSGLEPAAAPRLGAVTRTIHGSAPVIIVFTILVLFFLYQEGESLASDFRRVLRQRIGEPAELMSMSPRGPCALP